MADNEEGTEGFDPQDYTAAAVVEHLQEVDPAEAQRIIEAEKAADKPRKTVLEAGGVGEPRYEPDGREKYPWEV